MISLATVSFLWFGRPPSLPLRYAKASLRVFNDRLTSTKNKYSLEGDNNRLYMKSWNPWKYFYRFYWIHNFWVAVLFAVSIFASSFSLLFLSTCIYCATLAVMKYIPELKSGFFLVATSFYNITFFWCSIVINYILISWICITVRFLI